MNGQSVLTSPDGSFLVQNVPAGAPVLRATATRILGGVPLFGASEFFRVTANETYTLENLSFSPFPLPTVISLSSAATPRTITDPNGTAQVLTTALLPDNSSIAVDGLALGSTYTSSNPAILTVDEDGLVTPMPGAQGTAFITILNRGAATVAAVSISPGDPLTTVEGFVLDATGQPAVGATVSALDLGALDVTDVTGHYCLVGVPTLLGDVRVYAEGTDAPVLQSRVGAPLAPVPGGLTDAGLLRLQRPEGKILIVNDEWGLSDSGFSQSCGGQSALLAQNLTAWFAEGEPGSFLAYSSNFSLTGGALRAVIEGEGHTWKVSPNEPFTFANLAQYDGIFLADFAPANQLVLRAYLSAGGALYVAGGITSSSGAFANSWNPLLGRFGLGFSGSLNGLNGCVGFSTNTHQALAGMTSFYHQNGQDVLDTLPGDAGGQIVATSGSRQLFAVYDPEL